MVLVKKSDFKDLLFPIKVGQKITRKELLYKLQELYFERNDFDFKRGTFRVRGDVIDLIPASQVKEGIRIELFGDEIENIYYIDTTTGKVTGKEDLTTIYPAKLFVTNENQLIKAMKDIKDELYDRLKVLRSEGKLVEAQRLEQRTLFDLEMMKEVGYCSGIENYSMHMAGRTFGDKPTCLIDYFPDDFITIIDESHITVPQIKAMYSGDKKRKTTLVEHGFRLPSALENRPLQFDEFRNTTKQTIYVSATPSDYELEQSEGVFVEQIIRPTGLLDPLISVRPIATQIDDLVGEIRIRMMKNERVLVTTLTKRMSEDLSDYLFNLDIKVAYIHSDIDSLERVEIIRDFRLGEYDVLVGVNLLREGLDMPEVSLVAILDADKEGFLRSASALLQTAGRTARNVNGLVILYADRVTKAMKVLIDETNRRREIQTAYNEKHGIDPKTIYKSLEEILESTSVADVQKARKGRLAEKENIKQIASEPTIAYMSEEQKEELLEQMFIEMKKAAVNLDFERAANLRDEIARIKADEIVNS